ncbi:MAG: tRNA (adenine(22)-N(1))-methyltransferase TrmK, partial [Myxococcales bacterium]|nr:tRNA (adenine(22)-N(1))-methyltransferase TrmK [Myxococcales bacterium]
MRARLEAIYAAIPDRARRVADVGYDQGLLIDALLLRRPGVRVVGVERQDAAAQAYRERHEAELATWGARLALRTGDGLTAILPGEVDVAVIAGIGARSVARMLRAAPGV